MRVVALFAITGATCGAWIGWQVYRERHPGTPLLPRFKLSTLLLLVIAWGFVLLLFRPGGMPG